MYLCILRVCFNSKQSDSLAAIDAISCGVNVSAISETPWRMFHAIARLIQTLLRFLGPYHSYAQNRQVWIKKNILSESDDFLRMNPGRHTCLHCFSVNIHRIWLDLFASGFFQGDIQYAILEIGRNLRRIDMAGKS